MPIPAMVGAALATGAFGIGSQVLGGIQRRNQYAKQRSFNKEMAQYEWMKNFEMADLAWQRNKEMWHMQNQYNSPQAQMARWKEAGLNPNLIYGQGTPGNAQNIPQYQPPAFNAPNQPVDLQPLISFDEVAKQALNIMQSVQATKKMKADAKKAGTEAWLAENTKQYAKDMSKEEAALKAIQRKIEQAKSKYWETGINPSDMIWFRFGTLAIKELTDNWESIKSKLMDTIKDLKPNIKAQFIKIFSNPVPWMN